MRVENPEKKEGLWEWAEAKLSTTSSSGGGKQEYHPPARLETKCQTMMTVTVDLLMNIYCRAIRSALNAIMTSAQATGGGGRPRLFRNTAFVCSFQPHPPFTPPPPSSSYCLFSLK
ncbi:hypothetical protein ACOMHN_043546 [Nucella lapillus]